MVEKVFISPNRVRAYGNIVNMKTGDDFTLVNSELTVTTDTVDGAEMTVFMLQVESGITIALVSSASTCNVGDNVLLTATVVNGTDPVEAAEVTFKVGDTVLGTDETDANGVATYTYAASTAGSFSFTASYQTITSSAVSVSVNQTYLFYDSCASDNTSQYTNFYEIWSATSTVNTSLSFDTDHYVLTNSNACFSTCCLPVNSGLDDWKLTAKIRLLTNSANKGGGVGVATKKEKGLAIFQPNGTSNHLILDNYQGAVSSNVAVNNLSTNDYNTFELIKSGQSLTFNIYDTDGTQRFTKQITVATNTDYSNCIPCISVANSDSIYVKEIKLESL